jgi:hypothetical protein
MAAPAKIVPHLAVVVVSVHAQLVPLRTARAALDAAGVQRRRRLANRNQEGWRRRSVDLELNGRGEESREGWVR